MSLVLSLDFGTTNFKASVFDASGKRLALSRRRAHLRNNPSGRYEIAPENFWNAVSAVLSDVRKQVGDPWTRLAAISFASQANSFLLLDAHDQPLTPILSWRDERGVPDADELISIYRRRAAYPITGVPEIEGRFSVVKVAWVRKEQPELYAQTRRLCYMSDYFVYCLTGQHATEGGLAGLTGLMNIQTLRWDESLCETFEVPRSWLPSPVRAGTDLGPVRGEMAQRLELPSACHLVMGCLDQYAGAIGTGCRNDGDLCETTGTVLATVRLTERYEPQNGSLIFWGPSFSDKLYYQMLFGDTSANVLEAYRAALPETMSFTALTAFAALVSPGAAGLTLREPIDLARPETMFVGRTSEHERGHEVRAILEAVAAALHKQVTSLCGDQPLQKIYSTGGGARNDLWREIKAQALGITPTIVDDDEPTTFGAAVLALSVLLSKPVPTILEEI